MEEFNSFTEKFGILNFIMCFIRMETTLPVFGNCSAE